MSTVDQDDQIARYADALARLRGLAPAVAQIVEVLRDIVPPKPGRWRRWPPGDEDLFAALYSLPADLGDDFETATDKLEETLADMQGAAAEAAREELAEAEERVRELRQRLGFEPGDTEGAVP